MLIDFLWSSQQDRFSRLSRTSKVRKVIEVRWPMIICLMLVLPMTTLMFTLKVARAPFIFDIFFITVLCWERKWLRQYHQRKILKTSDNFRYLLYLLQKQNVCMLQYLYVSYKINSTQLLNIKRKLNIFDICMSLF